MADSSHAHDDHGHGFAHPVPLPLLAAVFLALVGLTIVTVITGQMKFEGFDLVLAMIIATTKASLVCAIFMHLKWDKPFLGMIFVFSVMFVGLFLAFTFLDSHEYNADITEYVRDKYLIVE
jgi:cytochrome c oxidase subunit 4